MAQAAAGGEASLSRSGEGQRLDKEVRAAFGESEAMRWAALYGRLQSTRRRWEEDGDLTGASRARTQVKELPGVSPQLVRYHLPTCVFLRTTDFAYTLPPFTERVEVVQMAPAQAAQYHQTEATLYALLRSLSRKAGQAGMGAVYLQTCLARPNAAFRREQVWQRTREVAHRPPLERGAAPSKRVYEWNTKHLLTLEAITPEAWLPKEVWLRDYAEQAVSDGHKLLLFVRQTGERDIQPRLVALLESAGLRAVALPASVPPRRRERWIAEQMESLDVLLVNPERVKTGLDLVAFDRVVFFEGACTYSLTTMWQAQRRVWRLGQTRPVEVVYLVYAGTLEEEALALLGQKFAAAASLYGDSAASALAEDAGDGDLLGELLRRKLAANAALRVDGLRGILTVAGQSGQGWVPPLPVVPPIPRLTFGAVRVPRVAPRAAPRPAVAVHQPTLF